MNFEEVWSTVIELMFDSSSRMKTEPTQARAEQYSALRVRRMFDKYWLIVYFAAKSHTFNGNANHRCNGNCMDSLQKCFPTPPSAIGEAVLLWLGFACRLWNQGILYLRKSSFAALHGVPDCSFGEYLAYWEQAGKWTNTGPWLLSWSGPKRVFGGGLHAKNTATSVQVQVGV